LSFSELRRALFFLKPSANVKNERIEGRKLGTDRVMAAFGMERKERTITAFLQ